MVILFQIIQDILHKLEHRASILNIIPSPEEWMGGSMHQAHKVNTKNCFYTKSDPHIALLQIRSTPLGPGLPSPATLLFNHPIRSIMPTINRPSTGLSNDDEHYKAWVKDKKE